MPAIAKNKQNTAKEIKKEKLKSKIKKGRSPEKSIEAISSQLQKKIEEKQKRKKEERGIVLVKNIPHGFYEEQMRSYFKQFGKVTRIRVGRSLITGNSRGFGYVEFEIPEVAQIAAETMNNYLMFNKIVKTVYIPPEEQKHNYFKTSLKLIKNAMGKTRVVSKKTKDIGKHIRAANKWDETTLAKRSKNTTKKVKKLNKLHSDLGIDFSNILLQQNDNNSSNTKKTSEFKTTSEEKVTKNSKNKKSVKKIEDLTSIQSNKKNNKNTKSTIKQNKISVVPSTSKGSETQKNKAYSYVDLLGESMKEEDSSDEDFVLSSDISVSDEEEDNTKNYVLGNLLEQTIEEEDSSDEDFIPELEDKCFKKESPMSVKPLTNKKKINPGKGLNKSEKILKRKPLSNGIQKQKQNMKKHLSTNNKRKENLKSAALELLLNTNVRDTKKSNFKKQVKAKK